jgi:hypothetical protein
VKKSGQYQQTKDLVKKRVAAYRAANPEKVSEAKRQSYLKRPDYYAEMHKKYYEENKETCLQRQSDYRAQNYDVVRSRDRKYKENNRVSLRVKQKEYYLANREDRVRYAGEYVRKRLSTDPLYRLCHTVRRRISLAIASQGYTKNSRTSDMLGCDWLQLKAHIERGFTDGMNWDNRSKWHIDHIMPLASAGSEDELIALCHYKNLQPLWAFDNLSKGAKLNHSLVKKLA